MIRVNYSEIFQESKKCIKCNKYPTIQRRHSGQNLCVDCFERSIEKIISKTISKYKMLRPNDKIIVALSESKNSITLLYNLKKIQEQGYSTKPIIALSIEEENTSKLTKELCENLSIKQIIINSNEIDTEKSFLSQLIKIASTDLGGNILALGHDLTNLAYVYLYNLIINKDPYQMIYYQDDYIKVITPLMRIPKVEIDIYYKIKKMGVRKILKREKKEKPNLENDIENFLNDCKTYSPEIEFNLLNGLFEITEIYNKKLN